MKDKINNEQEIRKQFKIKILEAIHQTNYKKACKIEDKGDGSFICDSNGNCMRPITIGRVMQAIGEQTDIRLEKWEAGEVYCELDYEAFWKLINKDGTDCTDDDQELETIKILLQLIKENEG